MNKLTSVITSLLLAFFSLQSNASLIQLTADQATYEIGDTVLLDIAIESIHTDTAELGFKLNFDNSAISFDAFNFSDDILNSAFFAPSPFISSNVIDIFVLWWDSSDLPASSFNIGQVSFTAQQAYDQEFRITDAYLANWLGDDIESPTYSVSVPVPEPSTSFIMLLGLLLLPLQKKWSSSQN